MVLQEQDSFTTPGAITIDDSNNSFRAQLTDN